MKVLVVDDDRDQRQLRSQLLARHGFEAIEAPDGATAKALAMQHHPEVVVLDLGLPTLDHGLALIRELHSLNQDIHLIVLTGRDRSALENRPEAKLVNHLLIKPTSTAKLVRTLRSYQ
jgi:two-component system KDP operon response regulator KdpE